MIFHYICIYHTFFIHSSVDGHLGCFHILAIVNSVAMNIGVHVSFQYKLFSGYMHRSGIRGSYDSSSFSFVSSLHAILLVCTICNPMDHSLPGSSVHGILQARLLRWVAISFSKSDSAVLIYISTNSGGGFSSLHTIFSIYVLWIFWW